MGFQRCYYSIVLDSCIEFANHVGANWFVALYWSIYIRFIGQSTMSSRCGCGISFLVLHGADFIEFD